MLFSIIWFTPSAFLSLWIQHCPFYAYYVCHSMIKLISLWLSFFKYQVCFLFKPVFNSLYLHVIIMNYYFRKSSCLTYLSWTIILKGLEISCIHILIELQSLKSSSCVCIKWKITFTSAYVRGTLLYSIVSLLVYF